MKKCVALLISMMLMITVCIAFAGTGACAAEADSPDFVITVKPVEGYSVDQYELGRLSSAAFKPENNAKGPTYVVSVVRNTEDKLKDATMTDDPEDEIAKSLKEQFESGYKNAELEIGKTSLGTPFVQCRAKVSDSSEFLGLSTVYKGFSVNVMVNGAEKITDDNIKTAIKILSELEIKDKEPDNSDTAEEEDIDSEEEPDSSEEDEALPDTKIIE